jgi:hypothetical protein
MPRKSDTTDKADPKRESQPVTLLIEEAEPEEKTDQESKEEEEETSVTFTMNSTKKNTKNPKKSPLPSDNKLLNNHQSQNNLKS